jgi:hypothetical protein
MFAWRRTALRRRVLVNLRTEKAFSGIIWAKRGPLIILRDAAILESGRPPVAMDGELLIERSNVDFIQVLPPVVVAREG